MCTPPVPKPTITRARAAGWTPPRKTPPAIYTKYHEYIDHYDPYYNPHFNNLFENFGLK